MLMAPRNEHAHMFIHAMPWWWWIKASRLSRSALLVGLALWRLHGVKKRKPAYLPNFEVASLGVHRNTKLKALRELEAAGLVTVERQTGKSPRVTLVI